MAVFLAHRKVAEKITEGRVPTLLDGEVPNKEREWKNLFSGKTWPWEDVSGCGNLFI